MFLLAYMMVIHFVADFLLQSRDMGKNKSTKVVVLLQHLAIQFGCFLLLLSPFVGFEVAFAFSLLNAIVHGVIDWNIWRLYKLSAYVRIKAEADRFSVSEEEKKAWMAESAKNWQFWEDHWFFATIGLDQLLHTLTIIALCGLIM